MSAGVYPKRHFCPNKIFVVNADTLSKPTLGGMKTKSSHVSPADAFAIYFNFWYNLGICPFKLHFCLEERTWKVITNWKHKVRNIS